MAGSSAPSAFCILAVALLCSLTPGSFAARPVDITTNPDEFQIPLLTTDESSESLRSLLQDSTPTYPLDGKSVSNAAKMNIGNDTVAGAVIEKLGNDGVLEKSKSTSRRSLLDIVALANKMLDTALDAATLSIGGRIKFASDGNGNLDVTTTLFYPTDVSDEDMEEDAAKGKSAVESANFSSELDAVESEFGFNGDITLSEPSEFQTDSGSFVKAGFLALAASLSAILLLA